MSTTVTSSIGTASRDYSTLQAWEDAAPANLVTADQIWRGEAYNDSEYTASGYAAYGIRFQGSTTDDQHYKELTAAVGQSFQDNARSNLLNYDQANGVGIHVSGYYSYVIRLSEDYVRVSRLQWFGEYEGISGLLDSASFTTLKDCFALGGDIAVYSGLCVNVCKINGGNFFTNTTTNPLVYVGCASLRSYDDPSGGSAYESITPGKLTLISCLAFGYAIAVYPASDSIFGHHNATDAASGFAGSNNIYNVPYGTSTPFMQADQTAGDLDFRTRLAWGLAGNGYLDATNAPLDISGFTRPTSPTIGHWQVDVAEALDVVTATYTPSPQTISFNDSTKDGDSIMVIVMNLFFAVSGVSVSDGAGNTYDLIQDISGIIRVWFAPNALSVSGVTLTGGTSSHAVQILRFSGNCEIEDYRNANGNGTTASSGSLTVAMSKTAVGWVAVNGASGSIIPETGWAATAAVNAALYLFEWLARVTAGSYAATATDPTFGVFLTDWYAGLLLVAAASPPPPTGLRFILR